MYIRSLEVINTIRTPLIKLISWLFSPNLDNKCIYVIPKAHITIQYNNVRLGSMDEWTR